jgi:hypothetical protein
MVAAAKAALREKGTGMNLVMRAAVCAAVFGVGGLARPAHAFLSILNGLGQGTVQEQLWVFPNQPPATPNFTVVQQNPPVATLGPVPGADPRTHVIFQGTGDHSWQVHSAMRAASGDSVDWHSMLPHVTPSSADATGTCDVVGAINFIPGSATFTITWSASDPGVAMHIGWFENGNELFETPIMVGPFSRVDVFTISTTGPIELLDMEISGAAVSRVPAPAGFAVLGMAAGVLRRRRRA